jgi:hypothetical protein
VLVAGGSATLSGDTIENNTAEGGTGGTLDALMGPGFGGGIYVASGIATLCNDTVESNSAVNPPYPSGVFQGPRYQGGGVYIASGATVYIDTAAVDTVDPTVVTNNTDGLSGLNGTTANIYGTYIARNC